MRTQESNQIVAHYADANLDLTSYGFSSQDIAQEVVAKAAKDAEDILIRVMGGLLYNTRGVALCGQLFEVYMLVFFFPRGGTVTVADFAPSELPVLAGSMLTWHLPHFHTGGS